MPLSFFSGHLVKCISTSKLTSLFDLLLNETASEPEHNLQSQLKNKISLYNNCHMYVWIVNTNNAM